MKMCIFVSSKRVDYIRTAVGLCGE
uniref:Uncharacterized protein n=1 Tax=Rhizophora mucronata TaxID=61149 RepID=A0A2P2P8X9_RHIMU